MSSKHDKKKGKHQASGSGGGVGALLDVFSSSSNATMAAKTAEWESKGDAGVVGDDVRCCWAGGGMGWGWGGGWVGVFGARVGWVLVFDSSCMLALP